MANSMDEGDRISMLPDDIIGCILSFLPMKRAIQTGVLSKSWRDLWKFNPVLEFSSVPISRAEVVDYSFINHCLSLYIPSRIEKLIIVLNVGFFSRPNIAVWVDFAIAKHVRSLEFYWVFCMFNRKFFELPKSFYAEKNKDSLVNLVLSGVRFSGPQLASGFRGFRFLKSLTLCLSVLRDEELEAIMTACLVLERLALHECLGHYRVKVSSRVLKEFKFYPREKAEDLEIIAPNLVTLKILRSLNIIRLDKSCNLLEATLIDLTWELEKSRVQKFMGQLTMVKVLSANHWLLVVRIDTFLKLFLTGYLSGHPCKFTFFIIHRQSQSSRSCSDDPTHSS